jgi:hypothetical protein
MKRILLFVIAAAVLVSAFFLYRYRWHISGNRLQVDPHAREEIEKAKRR